MAVGRWYPTATVMGDGRVMAFSGLDINGGTTPAVQFFTAASGWSPAVNAPWTPPLYPRMTLLPNGKVFYSGPGASSALFDPVSQTWAKLRSTNSPRFLCNRLPRAPRTRRRFAAVARRHASGLSVQVRFFRFGSGMYVRNPHSSHSASVSAL